MIIAPFAITLAELRNQMTRLIFNINTSAHVLQQAYSGTDPNKVFESGTYRSTTVSLGLNPAVGSKPLLSPPTITSGQIEMDGLNNPYTVVNFEIDQQTVDDNSVVAFKVYRQEVPAEDLAQEVEAFSKADFDKISQQSTRSGKFSAEKKAAYTIDQFKQSQVNLNTNLHNLQATSNQQNFGSIINDPSATGYPDYFASKPPKVAGPVQLVATINYQDAEAKSKLKQVYVKTKNKVTLSYTDHNVAFGTGYIYTLTSYCSTSDESGESDSISMVVLNLKGINRPTTCQVKQVSETKANLIVSMNPADLVKYVYVYRRNSEDLTFHPFDIAVNANNSVTIVDEDLEYLNSYVYRVLLENVFGAVSEPVEVKLTCTTQHIVNRTRSNNLKLPIILASQDQNSDGIKLTIFPNDPRVLYYELERRNLTAGETVFNVPQNKTHQLWPLNQFFVKQLTGSLSTTIAANSIASGSLPAQSQFIKFADRIEFVDKVITGKNYYQYRTAGYDLYGNVTGYGFASLAARSKNVLRAPINFVAETLRETPFRVKLTWEDDNQASLAEQNNSAQQRYLQVALQQASLSKQQQDFVQTMVENQDIRKVDVNALLAPYNVTKAQLDAIQTELSALQNISNPLRFQLQRRLSGDAVYSSFPYTENNFVIDEVATPDSIVFSPSKLSSSAMPQSSSLVAGSTASLSRSFGIPPFMQSQQVYQYRVAATTLDGATSDFSIPITVIASAQISDPVSFSASILNPRVTPIVVRLQWALDPLKNRPDHWRIERRVNVPSDTYRVIGNSYLDNVYFDRSAQIDQQYIYRIRSVSAVGDESNTQTTSIST